MNYKNMMVWGAVSLLFAGQVLAAPTDEEIKQLGTSLTPLGAIKAGNANGTIPSWEGGLCTAPAGYKPIMGDKGGSMGDMRMPLPENTLPMMSGDGPFGGLEMGGMFTTLKVREGLARNDYKDPGWYQHPKGTVAYEWTGETPPAPRAPGVPEGPAPKPAADTLNIKRDGGGHQHHH